MRKIDGSWTKNDREKANVSVGQLTKHFQLFPLAIIPEVAEIVQNLKIQDHLDLRTEAVNIFEIDTITRKLSSKKAKKGYDLIIHAVIK